MTKRKKDQSIEKPEKWFSLIKPEDLSEDNLAAKKTQEEIAHKRAQTVRIRQEIRHKETKFEVEVRELIPLEEVKEVLIKEAAVIKNMIQGMPDFFHKLYIESDNIDEALEKCREHVTEILINTEKAHESISEKRKTHTKRRDKIL